MAIAKTISPGRLVWGDYVFLSVIVGVLLMVVWVGSRTFEAAVELEEVKLNAAKLATRFEDIGAIRKAGGVVEPEQCANKEVEAEDGTKKPIGIWSDCWAAVVALAPFNEFKNVLELDNETFGTACDRADSKTHGLIIVEKSTGWFSAGNTGTTYGPFDGPESLEKETAFRISLCDRWSNLVKVREVKF